LETFYRFHRNTTASMTLSWSFLCPFLDSLAAAIVVIAAIAAASATAFALRPPSGLTDKTSNVLSV
jgi:hypothetical protein